MTSLNPYQDAANQALAAMDDQLARLGSQSVTHARHARCIRAVVTAAMQSFAAELDAGADNFAALEALQNALSNALTSICSTVAGSARSPLAREAAFLTLMTMHRHVSATLGPDASNLGEFVGADIMAGRA